MFGDSEVEEEPEVGTQVPRRVRVTVVETSKFEPEKQPESEWITLIRKRTKAQTSKTSKATLTSTVSITTAPVAGKNKQTAFSK